MNHLLDHRSIGKSYALFSFFDHHAPGFPVWLHQGLKIRNALINYWRELHEREAYQEIESPLLLDQELWRQSGHMDYFQENMFFSEVEKRKYVVKPMSCPGAILVYNAHKRSHRELPLKLCELGHVHRNENSGSLHGLLRVRSFVQDDAHIFCRPDQLVNELEKIVALIGEIMKKCGFDDLRFVISVKEEGKKNYLGGNDDWKKAVAALEEALQKRGHAFSHMPGEAKFYGPSLDLYIKDRQGREWQCSTVQLDFNLPQRFNVHYYDEAGVRQVPLLIHRAIFGSLERFIGILLENYGMDLPFWMMPVQVQLINAGASLEYLQEIRMKLVQQGLRVAMPLPQEHLKVQIKESVEARIPLNIILGPKEEKARGVSLRSLKGEVDNGLSVEELFKRIKRLYSAEN